MTVSGCSAMLSSTLPRQVNETAMVVFIETFTNWLQRLMTSLPRQPCYHSKLSNYEVVKHVIFTIIVSCEIFGLLHEVYI